MATLYHIDRSGDMIKEELLEWINMFKKIKEIPNHPFNREISKKNIIYIDVTGHVVQVKVEWIFSKFMFKDYYQMLKEDGKWLIVNKVWYTNPL